MTTVTRQQLIPLQAIILAAGVLSGCGKKTVAPSVTPPPETVNTTNPASLGPKSDQGFEKLKGKWRRPDGGYVLEIRGVTAEGRLEAGYFNPRPINVARAEASRQGANLRVFIELRDLNYPGSTYSLVYHPTTDRLSGNYFQAALNQNFDVEFVRQP